MVIKSKVSNNNYREEWEKVFGNKDQSKENPIVKRNRELINRKDFEYPPIETPDYDKPETYKEAQKH